jgi:hypothetical protein
MQNEKSLRLAGLLGAITATACIAITLPELLENVSYLGIIGYTFGVVVITNKFNYIIRGK